jgi:hypothetical protein
MNKVREFRSPYGSRWPLVRRRIGMALKLFASKYPENFFKWPERLFYSRYER